MKKNSIKVALIFFLFGCFNPNKKVNDEETIQMLYKNDLKNNFKIDSIITYKAPTNYKNITVDFDFYQVIYKTNNQKNGSKFYTLTKNEIYRLGQGPNCIIFSKEMRWKKTGELITNLRTWLIENDEEKILEKPIVDKFYKNSKIDKYDLPNNMKAVVCH